MTQYLNTGLGDKFALKQESTRLFGVEDTIGATNIIAAPGAGYAIRLITYKIWNNVATDNVVTLKDGASAIDGYRLTTKGSGWIESTHPYETITLTENTALTIDLSAATEVGYSIRYFIVEV